MLFPATIAGSLPKPAWLAETEKLWPKWIPSGAALDQAKRDAALIWLKEQEDAGIATVSDGEQFRTHFVHGFLETVEGIDWDLKTKMGIRNNRYVVDVPTVTGRPKRSRPVHRDEAAFCRSHAGGKLKWTLPGPMTICDTLADAHYGRRADMIIGVDLNKDRREWGERFGMTHFVNPKEIDGDIVPHLVNMTKRGADQIGGADYTFDCTGNTRVMRQALEASHRGWGQSIVIGVAGAGQEISTRPVQLVTGRTWKGTAFGGARGRTDVPRIVDWYMDGKIQIDPMITHRLTLDEINKGFDLMHAGESIRSVVVY